MSKVQVAELEMAYHIDGSGEPVLLIGGFGMVKESWELQVVGLAKQFRVVSFDNRGVGETTAPLTAPGRSRGAGPVLRCGVRAR